MRPSSPDAPGRAALAPRAPAGRVAAVRRAAALTLLLLALPAPRLFAQGAPAVTALRFGALVNPGEPTVNDAVVVVQGDTVVSVGSGAAAIPAGAWVVDLRPLTALPGLIDVHTHITYVRDKDVNPRGPSPSSRDSVLMLAADNAMKTLETGVTTIRDLNASGGLDIAMRDAINRGEMVGPRMFVAGRGMSKRSDTTTVDIPAFIRAQVDAGVDWIKMFGSTGSGQDVTGRQTFSDAEMRLAVRTAHAYGKPIAIHSYGPAGARGALLAGANSIEHPVNLSDDLLKEWAARGTFYVPTIDHNRFYRDNATLLGYPDAVQRLDSFIALNIQAARRAHDAGIPIAMGSDALYWMFGENTRELGQLVKAGLTPEEALEAATVNGAALLGKANKLGRVAPGYYADIAAVAGDPLRDVQVVIDGVRWVMKGGDVVVDRRGSPPPG